MKVGQNQQMTFNPNNKKPFDREWVIKLVNLAEKSVRGYEKYLLDKIDYSELAKIMTELRDVLPKNNKKD